MKIFTFVLCLVWCLHVCAWPEVGALEMYQRKENYFALWGNSYYSPSTAIRLIPKTMRLSSVGVADYVWRHSWGANCVFARVNKGDVVSWLSLENATNVFQRVHDFVDEPLEVVSGTTIKINSWGDVVYLGFLVTDYNGYPLSIGWVALQVNETYLSVVDSVIDSECGDLVVGETAGLGGVPLDGGTWQNDIYVDAQASGEGWGYSWSGAWRSIQDAIWAMRDANVTIHVRPGCYGAINLDSLPYHEELYEVKDVRIVSTDGAAVTFIDGGGWGVDDRGIVTNGVWCAIRSNHGFYPQIVLQGFTLRNGLGGAFGISRLENCVIENCHYGLSNSYPLNCRFTNVTSPVAPGSGTTAVITNTPSGVRVTPAEASLSDVRMLFGTPVLNSREWSVTMDFNDLNFYKQNHFFTIGVYNEFR